MVVVCASSRGRGRGQIEMKLHNSYAPTGTAPGTLHRRKVWFRMDLVPSVGRLTNSYLPSIHILYFSLNDATLLHPRCLHFINGVECDLIVNLDIETFTPTLT